MEISEKVAYLKGLAEGLDLDTESKEGKLIAAIIDVLDDMSEALLDLEDELCDVEEGLDAVSDDLSEVEECLFELDDEDGRLIYEVEFKSGNMEYSYEINAATGAILKHEAELDD